MNAPSVDIKQMLESYGESSGISVEFTSDVFIGREPDKPDNCITIFDTGAYSPSLGISSSGYEYPTIQIRVRNQNYINGWNIIEEIKTALHGVSQQTVNGTLYSVIYCSSGPALLDYDDFNRVRFIINFNVQRR
jgi:hypothetical protein